MEITANGKTYFDGLCGIILLKSDYDVIEEIEINGISEILLHHFLKMEKGAYSFNLHGTIEYGEKFYVGIENIKKIEFLIEDLL